MFRSQTTVQEVFEMVILQNRDSLYTEKQRGFERKLTPTSLHQFFVVSRQILQHNEIEILLLAAPVHMRHTDAALHRLENFSLLKNS